MIDCYPRETVDFIPFDDLTLTVESIELEYAVAAEFDRPLTWAPVVTNDAGTAGFVLDGPSLGRGVFRVFVRATGLTTTPVIDAGYIRLT